jgi:hypothetical protein
VRTRQGRSWRATTLDLAYVAGEGPHPVYLIRVEGSVFATDAPGVLLDMVGHPAWLDSLASREWTPRAPLAASDDSAAILAVTRRIESSPTPTRSTRSSVVPSRPVGLVGPKGRRRDGWASTWAAAIPWPSIPARIVSEEQLRHAMAHELGHRWQSRAPAQMRALWRDVPPIPDQRRLRARQHRGAPGGGGRLRRALPAGHRGDAGRCRRPRAARSGTSCWCRARALMTRYLALQPIYARHPMRRLLIGAAS